MKKFKILSLLILTVALILLCGCDKLLGATTMSLSFDDIAMVEGEKIALPQILLNGEEEIEIKYSSSSECVKIEDFGIVAVSDGECVITVTAGELETSFNVSVTERGNLIVGNIELEEGETKKIKANITSKELECEVNYTFSGNNIEIIDGEVKGLVQGTVTVVTASTPYHTTAFTVTVKEDVGTMTLKGPDKIFANYPGKPIEISFSNPKFETEVFYSASVAGVYVENGVVYAKGNFDGDTKVTVTARSEHHKATFDLTVSVYNAYNSEKQMQYYESTYVKEENKGGLIFVGDSYFSGFPKGDTGLPPFWSDFYTDFSGEKAFLLGVSQSGIADWEMLSERVVFPMEPSEIAVHVGFNDVHHGSFTPEALAARIIKLLDSYHERLPEAKVYYFGIEPKKNAFSSDSAYKKSSLVDAPIINAAIKSYADVMDWLVFLDTDPYTYTTAGKTAINQSFYLSTDLSHPTLPAYDSYRELLNNARGKETEKPVFDGTLKIDNYGVSADINGSGKTFTSSSGAALTSDYVVKGTLKITSVNKSNAHLQFRFSKDFRFLLWDSNNNGLFAAGYIGGGTYNDKTEGAAEPYDANSTLTLEWAIAVKDGVAYWFINGVQVAKFDAPTLEYFNIGALQMNVEFTNIEISAKSDDADAFNSAIAELGLN